VHDQQDLDSSTFELMPTRLWTVRYIWVSIKLNVSSINIMTNYLLKDIHQL